ncbi:MAG: histidine phosphatase family protein [Dehalococcoidia bacterium]
MTSARRVRTIDLEDPFVDSFEGMCEVLLIRHGEQQFFDNIPVGQAYDAPLSEMGQKQAKAVGERLAEARLGRVYCSDMRRAHDTAKAIAKHHGYDPIVVPGLREIDLWQRAPQDKGLRDLYTNEELVAVYREVTRTRRHDAWPLCEDVDGFRARIFEAFDKIIAECHGMRVAIVCHGGVINTVLSSIVGSAFDNIVAAHHTSITVIRAADTRRVLLTVNDYSHVMAVQTRRGDLNA